MRATTAARSAPARSGTARHTGVPSDVTSTRIPVTARDAPLGAETSPPATSPTSRALESTLSHDAPDDIVVLSGLFRRAILQSLPGTFFTPDLAASVAKEVSAELGHSPRVDDLADVPPDDLIAAARSVTESLPQREGP